TQTYVVPEPSERWTTMMSWFGSVAPGLTLASRASFHLVILPRKMSASTSGVNFTVAVNPGRLYVGTTAPSTVGTWSTLPWIAAIAESVIGASVPPKSTVLSENWRIPPPEPIDW